MTETAQSDLRGVLDDLKAEASGNGQTTIGNGTGTLLGVLRLAIGSIFAWGFLDNLFGLGFSTCRMEDGSIDAFCDGAMINGGSPTWGFLNFGTGGSHTSGLVTWLATDAPNSIGLVDFLYMLALLVVGVTFVFGIALRLGALAGVLLMASIYLASSVWPEFHPFMTEHIIYSLVMVLLAVLGAGRWLGYGKRWAAGAGSRSPYLA